MNEINKETIINPERYISDSKMTKSVLLSALECALKKLISFGMTSTEIVHLLQVKIMYI